MQFNSPLYNAHELILDTLFYATHHAPLFILKFAQPAIPMTIIFVLAFYGGRIGNLILGILLLVIILGTYGYTYWIILTAQPPSEDQNPIPIALEPVQVPVSVGVSGDAEEFRVVEGDVIVLGPSGGSVERGVEESMV